MWVSVPDTMEIPAPLIRRNFTGGLYAAHVLRAWDFEDWRLLGEWVNASSKYDSDHCSSRQTSMEAVTSHGLEETLNFHTYIHKGAKMEDLQLDLLFPVKENDNDRD